MPVEAAEYGVVRIPAPVLNSPGFKAVFGGTSGRDLKVDRCGQVRELEFVALPGSVFTILKKLRSGSADIYQVQTDEYAAPPNVLLYIDSRFLKLQQATPSPRRPSLPTREEVVTALRTSVGKPY
ncbi:MAG: peptidoglycan endopeptidase, partial [Geobacteraceae bacterium]|nr:peptidoglycan endopeptidase [Geobacteraceae bacterium]